VIAAKRRQNLLLIGRLNALSGDDDVAAMRELDERRHDLRGAPINANVGDERAIDLDLVDRAFPQQAQR